MPRNRTRPFSISASPAIGVLQDPSRRARKARSQATAVAETASLRASEQRARSFHHRSGRSRRWRLGPPREASPRSRGSRLRARQAQAVPGPRARASVASAPPSPSFFSRVSTLPRKSITRRSGRRRLTCAARRKDDVPMTAPGGRSASDSALALMKASRTSARGSTAAMTRPWGSCVGRSFIECTARSTAPPRSASSISLVNSPLPPKSRKGLS